MVQWKTPWKMIYCLQNMWTTKDHGTPESPCQALKETSSEPSILGPWPWQLFEQHKYTPDMELEI